MEGRHYISVILPLKLEWEPCYWTDEEVSVGDRVKVVFSQKEYSGVVSQTDVTPDIDPKKILRAGEIEKGMERILETEIELWIKVAEYYLCTIGEVYKAAYPSGKINLEEARAEARKKVCARREKTLNTIRTRLEKLQARLESKTELASNAKDGTKIKAKHLEDIEKIKAEIVLGQKAEEAAERHLLAAREGLSIASRPELDNTVKLSYAQNTAYEGIKRGFKDGKPVLLHGVTGSGKTEIYIKLAQEALNDGRNVLYLVPEIALSRQLEDRLYEHFGERMLVFHSAESLASRRNCAEIIRNMTSEKGGYIALCTRSGLFLPHHDLGLIIVDEEHDSSYKQDSPAPRYNGRDTALILNSLQKECNIILGSATPSLEEIYNTSSGRHTLVELKERYHGSEDSEIEIIDTKAERRKNGMTGNFSRKLIDSIRETLNKKEQVLILRSRRAWSTALQCTDCGEIMKCPHCNVSLSYHKTTGSMVCHYCGFKTPFIDKCVKCTGHLAYLGAGTQKIEEELTALFPEASVARLDSDSAQNKSFETKVIKDFAGGKIDILVGTQIITKGFDFSNLSLVAIIAADTLLGIQDFRADEKALHLMEQFRGRSGRRGSKGKFVIQTSQPEHPIYRQLAQQQDVSMTGLLLERKDFGFPPYTRIIELTLKDTSESRIELMASKLSQTLQKAFKSPSGQGLLAACPVTSPYSPVIDRVEDNYIRKIRISFRKDRQLSTNKIMLKEAILSFEKERKYTGHISIDVDPA
jgi:primosomal protein N' (replication factor Y)